MIVNDFSIIFSNNCHFLKISKNMFCSEILKQNRHNHILFRSHATHIASEKCNSEGIDLDRIVHQDPRPKLMSKIM